VQLNCFDLGPLVHSTRL